MSRVNRTKIGIGGSLLAAAIGLFSLLFWERTESCSALCMGTRAAVSFRLNNWSHPRKTAESGFKIVLESFAEVENAANLHDMESELSRLNATAHLKPFQCSPLLWDILQESRRAWELSGGTFDITIKPLMDLWGFYRKTQTVPPEDEVSRCLEICGLEKVQFCDTDRSVYFTVPGMAIDLGGIAKGYALDLAKQRLSTERPDLKNAVIDLGGNLQLLGNKSLPVRIKSPINPKADALIITLNPPLAVASSGDYERFVVLSGKKYGHIIDPETGYPANKDYAVTVWCNRAVDSDWLSTTMFLRGDDEKLKQKLLRDIPELQMKFVFK